MSKATEISEDESILNRKPTLVRRVSNMLKDGNYSGPPMLFRHPSMQKIRHCCQNLNLFPYLLYSVDNSKSHPIARKVNLCLGQLLQSITERIFFLYASFRQTVLHGICRQKQSTQVATENTQDVAKTPRFKQFRGQRKNKENPLLLILAVYFAPLVLLLQLVGLFNLLIFGKYTPGFIFLITALLFLGCIKLKILFHVTAVHIKYDKKKTQ